VVTFLLLPASLNFALVLAVIFSFEYFIYHTLFLRMNGMELLGDVEWGKWCGGNIHV
jgi:hypothetical protein